MNGYQFLFAKWCFSFFSLEQRDTFSLKGNQATLFREAQKKICNFLTSFSAFTPSYNLTFTINWGDWVLSSPFYE